MFNQSVCIVEFLNLYNILFEIKNLFTFNVYNYQKSEDFIRELENNNIECLNSIIIVNKEISELISNKNVNKNHILVIEGFPLKVEKLIDVINTQLIKQKFNFQANINIKNYNLNLNSRIISTGNEQLKLTEKEIDIILFLNDHEKPQSINILQNKVWGYLFDLETHTVETHIYRLRKKISKKFNDTKFIISGENGYLL